MQNIKQFIKTNLYRKDGKLNSAVLRRDWFLQSKEFNEIIQLTNFLSDDSTITERIYCVLNDIQHAQICPICNVNVRAFYKFEYTKTCNDKKCIANHPERKSKIIETKIKLYGSPVSELQLQKFIQNSKEYNKKSLQTIKQKYGVDNISKIPGNFEKVKNTMLAKYGVTHWSHTDIAQEIYKNNRLNKFKNCTNIIKPTDEHLSFFPTATNKYSFKCNECSHEDIDLCYYTVIWRLNNFGTSCSNCSQLKYGSVFQNEIYDFITSLGIDCVRNYKGLQNCKKEIDIYIPDINIGIECNGLFWHSAEHFMSRDKSHLYDYEKFNEYFENGIRIFSIMEDEWKHRSDIVKSRIRNILGKISNKVYARNCTIKEIDSKTCNNFLDTNHIQGRAPSSYKLGAFFNDELVSVMTFTRNNITRRIKDTWEISRFCSKLDNNIIGIAGKLLSYFEKNMSPEQLISYADRRWSDGNLYKTLGFTFSHFTEPNYWYVDKHNIKRVHRFNLRKTKEDPVDISEEDLRRNQGYLRIYDYGSSKWIKTYDSSKNQCQ